MNRVGLVALASCLLFGCAAVSDDLRRAEEAFNNNYYEDALTWLVDLEDDAAGMDDQSAARYYYLRGRTEYLLGHRGNALHYLAVAREVAGDQGAGLRPEWRQQMDRTLEELTPRTGTHRPPDAESTTSGGESPPDGDSDAGTPTSP
jgi:hypothetical protein